MSLHCETELIHADRFHHWHGFTQMAEYEPLLIERASGCWLIDRHGRRLLDGVSSLWCNIHGHRHPRIDQAIREQLERVAHVTNIGMGCTTTAELSAKLASDAPGDLNHVFYSSDGASAVEVAIKMALQYWRQCGHTDGAEKSCYLALGSAYHGDTIGTVSLGDIPHFHRLFHPLLFHALRGPCPDSYRLPVEVASEDAIDFYAEQFEAIFAKHHRQLAALVIEPLVQGAAGLVMHPSGLLRRLRSLCDRYDVLMIADEVATGFGRTGRMFACEHEGVVPDIMCLGKGLTAGYLPMAATIASSRIFESFLGPMCSNQQFFHGHTYSGNPLAAAAAIASLEVFEQEGVLNKLPAKILQIKEGLLPLTDHPNVGDVRQLGMMVGIELVAERDSKCPFDAKHRVGRRVCEESTRRGVWIRPLGDVVILMPPLSISSDELDLLIRTVTESIFVVTRQVTAGIDCEVQA
jgi:adenosylmethionine-8-amino-7-oxononanoate aminotransferase